LRSIAIFLYNRYKMLCKILFYNGLFVITVVKPIYIRLSLTRSRTLHPPALAPLTSSIYSARPTTSQTQKKIGLSYLSCSIYLYPFSRAGSKARSSERGSRSERQGQRYGTAATAVWSGNDNGSEWQSDLRSTLKL
jgi:hypothetical protein